MAPNNYMHIWLVEFRLLRKAIISFFPTLNFPKLLTFNEKIVCEHTSINPCYNMTVLLRMLLIPLFIPSSFIRNWYGEIFQTVTKSSCS
jgi:hypothetical protein